ncbi:MAG: LLM class flavin-dependent oxidoreductase [Chloroflexi bacterium]|nr:LLM class flavin-dependent oxidoreductase [Chloroflexota bacterium]
MKIDIFFQPGKDFRTYADWILQAETWGFDAAWSAEWLSNPFFPLTIAAKKAQCPFTLGTIAACAFPRSPMITAQITWDLARQTGGRFVLGLEAEMPEFLPIGEGGQSSETVGKMREYIESLRAIWRSFQNDERLRYRGRHYQFRLMAPFFNTGPIKDPEVPIFLSGDDSDIYDLAGELCQGLHANVLHSRSYLRDVVVPHLSRGLESSGRPRESFEFAIPALVFTPDILVKDLDTQNEPGRNIASYAFARRNLSFATYHGWEALLDSLRGSALSGDSGSIWRSIPEEILREIAIVAEPKRVAAAIRQRYSGLADRVCLVFAFWNPIIISTIVADLKKQLRGDLADQA